MRLWVFPEDFGAEELGMSFWVTVSSRGCFGSKGGFEGEAILFLLVATGFGRMFWFVVCLAIFPSFCRLY